MIFDNKLRLPRLALVMLCCIATLSEAVARPAGPADDQADSSEESAPDDSPAQLAAQVRAIAGSTMISRAKKEKRISTAVRVAVVSATAYKRDSGEILGRALALTKAAAHAAPQFAEVIANAVSFTSSVSRIDGASGQIRTAAFAAAKGPRVARARPPVEVSEEPEAEPVEKPHKPSRRARPVQGVTDNEDPAPQPAAEPNQMTTDDEPAPGVRRPSRQQRQDALPNSDDIADSSSTMVPETSPWPKIMLGDSTAVDLTASLGVRHDDNIFVTSENKVGDTIVTLTPGVAMRFGLQSLAHGSLNYNESFVRYAGNKAPNVSLGSGAADFGYDNGSLTLIGSALFQQLNQNDNATSGLGLQQLLRRDIFNAAFNAEGEITAKTRLSTGVSYASTKYKTEGLIGTQETSVPLKIYFETTPKTSLSLGATYREVKPQDNGPSGHDLYYNVGARGNFTSKLSGEFSMGYRSRDVGANPAENLWGFDGNLSYELTPKSSLALVLSRDFSTGALGESLKNNRYALKLSTDPTEQWSFTTSISYQDSDYGPTVYNLVNVPVTTERTDRYWEGELSASYLFTHWLSLTADYTVRDNHSTLPGARYSNNVLSLLLTFRY